MRAYRLTELSDAVLQRQLNELVAKDRGTTAELLAHIAEFDERRLHVPAGFASMHAYCVEELRLSEDAAYKRIRAARAARQFPAIFAMLAEGRLHLAAVCLLAPHLTHENADELFAAATHRRKSEVEELVSQRFPDRILPVIIRPIPSDMDFTKLGLAPGRVDAHTNSEPDETHALQQASVPVELVPGRVGTRQVEAPQRYELKLTISNTTREKLKYAQELLSHSVPSGDVEQVLDRGLDALISQLEKRKFGACSKPRPAHRSTKSKRCIPASVRRAVWQRDHGQCTFVSDDGHRCGSRRFLEFDHVEPVARGGEATVDGVRLRCRAHNQLEAERVYGAGFMHEKRRRGRGSVAVAVAEPEDPQARDILAGLRGLGQVCRQRVTMTFPVNA